MRAVARGAELVSIARKSITGFACGCNTDKRWRLSIHTYELQRKTSVPKNN